MAAPSPSFSRGVSWPGRRRSRRRVRRRGIGAIVALLLVWAAVAAIGLWVTQSPEPDPAWPRAENIVVPATSPRSALGNETRPNFRYSIVEGGVHTGTEMRQAIDRDSVVASHYAGLDPSRFRVERLPTRTVAHVSYRIGHEVFWTRKKLVLEAGEAVLTDGTNIIRARCGNRVAMEGHGPERSEEPDAEAFEQLSDPAVVAVEPPTDPPHSGTFVISELQSLPLDGPSGRQSLFPLLFGPGWDSQSNLSGTEVGAIGLGADPGQDPTSDGGFSSGPGLGGSGLDPWTGLGVDPSTGLGLNPPPGLGLDPWPGPGLDPGPGLGLDPGANDFPLGVTETPIPTPEPSTIVLTSLGAVGWYLARMRRRSRARRNGV